VRKHTDELVKELYTLASSVCAENNHYKFYQPEL